MPFLKEMWMKSAFFARDNKIASFIAIFGAIYFATYPFGDPKVPTVKERLEQQNKANNQ